MGTQGYRAVVSSHTITSKRLTAAGYFESLNCCESLR